MAIYDRVKLLCDERKISMRQLSANCGFSPSSIGKWKHHTPSAEKVQVVADYFGVSTDWLNEKTDVRKYEQDVFYNDSETSEEAQELTDDHRVLMQAIPHLPPSRAKALRAIVDEMRGTNPDG